MSTQHPAVRLTQRLIRLPSLTPLQAGQLDTAARALNGVLRQAAGLVAVYAGLSGISNSLRSVTETGMAFGRKLKGLVRRRESEIILYTNPSLSS